MPNKFAAIFLALALASLTGCGWLAGGMEAQKGRPVVAEYTGLQDKSLAVVIYTHRASTNEFPAAREEISGFVVNELRKAIPTARIVDPRLVVRWQDEALNWDSLSERDIGKHFGVDRVLFIELIGYETKVPGTQGYVQGYVEANAKIFELDGPSELPAWQGDIMAKWPPDGPIDMMRVSEITVRKNALQRFAEKLTGYLYSHTEASPSIRKNAGLPN